MIRVVLGRLAPISLGEFSSHLPPQAPPPFTGQPSLYVELPDRDRSESRKQRTRSTPDEVANAIVRLAQAATKRDHEGLARDLGLNRPKVGFCLP